MQILILQRVHVLLLLSCRHLAGHIAHQGVRCFDSRLVIVSSGGLLGNQKLSGRLQIWLEGLQVLEKFRAR
jgi:hypothetical protein